jgi:dipeptidase E
MKRKLLLISNSTMAGEAYLGWPQKYIQDFLAAENVKKVTFVPFAGVGLSAEGLKASYDLYTKRVSEVFIKLGFEVTSVHEVSDPVALVNESESIAVGGGNTFHLVSEMQNTGIMDAIKKRAFDGMPYMGWSAGSNVACPTLMTTNDMPIIEPPSFNCMGLIPFQINPHYLDSNPEGHGGETREQRIDEFLVVNRHMKVLGLREASMLYVSDDNIKLLGSRDARLFSFGSKPQEFESGSELSFLL